VTGRVALAAAALAWLGLWLLANDYVLTVLVLAGIYAIIAVGLNVFTGYTGQISFGHNAFAAIGGYASAILTTTHGWPPLVALLAGAGLAVAVAAVVGYPTLRLRGHYLAMGTLALGLISYVLSVQLEGLTRGFTGISGIPPLALGPLALTTPRAYFVLVWLLVALAVGGGWLIVHSRLGLALRAIRGGEDAARALGIDVTRYKIQALAISAAYAAVGGSLFGHFVSYISPEAFGLYMVVLLFTMLFVGGIGTAAGPVVGAVVIGSLPEVLSGFKDYRELIYAAVLIVILLFAPRGVLGLVARRAAPIARA
jgi:branched-chain amino acid transport system permease protein